MNRILLADDSPHAQRMGERILREEGYEVVSVTDGETAILRLADVDPDVIIADVFLPNRSGIELCRHVKSRADHRHIRLVLTAGLLETFDEAEARSAGAEAIIKKPFEASAVLEIIKPLAEQARASRRSGASVEPPGIAPEPSAGASAPSGSVAPPGPEPPAHPQPPPGLSEQERVRAAVILALDSAFPVLVEQITQQVLTVRADRPQD